MHLSRLSGPARRIARGIVCRRKKLSWSIMLNNITVIKAFKMTVQTNQVLLPPFLPAVDWWHFHWCYSYPCGLQFSFWNVCGCDACDLGILVIMWRLISSANISCPFGLNCFILWKDWYWIVHGTSAIARIGTGASKAISVLYTIIDYWTQHELNTITHWWKDSKRNLLF